MRHGARERGPGPWSERTRCESRSSLIGSGLVCLYYLLAARIVPPGPERDSWRITSSDEKWRVILVFGLDQAKATVPRNVTVAGSGIAFLET